VRRRERGERTTNSGRWQRIKFHENESSIYMLPKKCNIYTLPKGRHQESNLEDTITEDGDPHQHPPQVPQLRPALYLQ
jgi:hypothetical protein